MVAQEISTAEREPFLTRFSRLHDGALVTVRVAGCDALVDQPFRGVSPDGEDLVIRVGDDAGHTYHAHRVPHVVGVRVEKARDDADAAIAMTTDDGATTEVRFRSPMRADLLDPAVE